MNILTTFLRVSKEPKQYRFGRIAEGNTLVGRTCPACGEVLKVGDRTALVPLGPGKAEDEQARCASGGWYTAVAVVVHQSCACGRELENGEKAEW